MLLLDSKRRVTVTSALALILPLLVYLATLAREITFVDSGELAAVAARLGIAHPSGYPLFTLLAHLATWLPIGTVAFRVGLLSALAASFATLVVYRTGRRLLRLARCPDTIATDWAPLSGALMLAFSRTFWSQAVIVEVYTLQALLLACVLAASMRTLRGRGLVPHRLPLVLLCGSFAVTNHLTGFLVAPALLFLLAAGAVDRAGRPEKESWPVLRIVAAAIAPLLLYIYLPLRSYLGAVPRWDELETWHRFWVHVTARQYHDLLGSRGLNDEELRRFFGEQLPAEASWMLIVLAVVGFGVLLWRVKRAAVFTVLIAGASLLYNLAYPIHDIAVYYIPVLVVCGLWAAVGGSALVWVTQWLARLLAEWLVGRRRGRGARLPGVAVVAAGLLTTLLCVASLIPLRDNRRANDQSRFQLLRRYVSDALNNTAPDAIVFSGDWDSFSSPALYYQLVENIRSDVTVLDYGRLAGARLAHHLARVRPKIAEACGAELAKAAELALLAERGRDLDLPAARADYQGMRRCLARAAVRSAPTYITSELRESNMFAGFHMHPEGLLLRLTESAAFQPCALPTLRGPGLDRLLARDRRELTIIAAYSERIGARVRYLTVHGRAEEAAAWAVLLDQLHSVPASPHIQDKR